MIARRGRTWFNGRVLGSLINVALIVLGTGLGLAGRQFAAPRQTLFRNLLGIFTIYAGLSWTWGSINGSFWLVMKQVVILFAAILLGSATGRLLGLQRQWSRLGQHANTLFQKAKPGHVVFSNGFITCTILFCAAPLALLGALHEGMTGATRTLVVKACMDGLAAMTFSRVFGRSVVLSALPVFALQAAVSTLSHAALPMLEDLRLADPIGATAGMLIAFVALVIFGIRKVPMADYLPALVYAPLIAWFWR